MTKLYISYGSNLNINMMKKRCPNARPIFQFKGKKINELKHWKLRFYRYANIVHSRNNKVPIGLWKITKKCEVDLDKYEQFPKIYKKKYISFLSKKVLVYVMRNKIKIKPTKKYMKEMLKGYKDFGLNKNELEKNKNL